jgi:membrane-bound lytic murein transglycosylase B
MQGNVRHNRKTMRWTPPAAVVLAALLAVFAWTGAAAQDQDATVEAVVETHEAFDDWLAGAIGEARERGYSEALIRDTLVGLQPLARVIQSDRSQAEAQPGFGRYLSTRLTPLMINRGREAARTHAALLGRIEAEFNVQRRFLLAIWGIETNFGRNTGSTPIFRALATLAWEPRRAAFFRGELFNALEMVHLGHIDARSMTGSWAGAMGQPQFMPSNYLQYAVDFDGDGRRDIWRSTADALASMANYLRGHGWDGDYTWGREVRVSPALMARIRDIPTREGGCSARRTMTEYRPLAEWQAMGVRLADGSSLPTADVEASFVDAGERQFLVYGNYDAILGYNCSHFYALTVALLGDALR